MLHELCNPVTTKLMALGQPLHEAEKLAAVIVVWVVLLYAMMGSTLSFEGIPQQVGTGGSRRCIRHRGTVPAWACVGFSRVLPGSWWDKTSLFCNDSRRAGS